MFEVHPITVKEWADAGKLPAFKTPGGRWRFVREEIEALLPDGGEAA